MNILFCGNDRIADGILISVTSIVKYTDKKLNIYILTAGNTLSSEFSEFLEKTVRAKNDSSRVMLFDISDMFSENLPLANMNTRFTPYCMLRLFADKVNELPDRLLYLDNDVVFCGDISALYDTDMGGAEIAGVLDYYGSHFFRKSILKRDYLNSGVLLLDLKKIRQSGLFEKCRQMCKEKKMFMPDQSALNKLAEKKILPRRFNEQRKDKDDTLVRHFTTTFRFSPYIHTVTVKPWDVAGLHSKLKTNEYDEVINDYLKLKENYSLGETQNAE